MGEFNKVDRYNKYKFETKDVYILFGLGAFSSAALKYLDRYQFKGTEEADLNKALYYLDASDNVHDFMPQMTREKLIKDVGPEKFLNPATRDALSIHYKNRQILVNEIIEDRLAGNNQYYDVIELLLMGQFKASRKVLLLLMKLYGVKISEQ